MGKEKTENKNKKIKDEDRRISMSVSLSIKEKNKLKKAAEEKGLSLSAFLRSSALENIEDNDKKEK